MGRPKQTVQGHKWERDLVHIFAEEFNIVPFKNNNIKDAEIGTTRMFSAAEDAKKVDIWFKKHILPRPIKIQAKKHLAKGTKTKSIKIESLLNMIIDEGDLGVLATRVTVPNGKKEKKLVELATVKLEDFLYLLRLAVVGQGIIENNPEKW